MKKLLPVLLFLVPVVSFCQNFSNPESVEYDTVNHRWLVSQNSSGQVLSYSPSSGALSTFCSGMTSGPYGIEILGNVLYCCDGGWVRGYDLTSGTQVFNMNLNATFLNGITSDGNNFLFVTDFSAKKIYRINPVANTFNLMATILKTPNGIIYDGPQNRLVFVTWGSNALVQSLSLSDSSLTTLATTTLSSFDGIIRDFQGNWYVSSWGNNSLNKFDPTFSSPSTVVMSGLSQPADLGINAAGDSIGIPNSSSTNTVVFYTVPAACVAPTVGSTASQPLCAESPGSAVLAVNGGSGPYTYLWSNGSTTQTLTAPAGSYGYTVTDSVGCTASSEAVIPAADTLLTEIAGTPDSQGTPNCNGSLGLTVSGGTPPYAVSWNNGATGASLTDLCQGWYNVTVTDANGCTAQNSVHIGLVLGESGVNAGGVMVFPNPGADAVTVSVGRNVAKGNVRVVDLTGRVALTKDFSGERCTLPTSDLADGCYELTVYENGTLINRKTLILSNNN